MLFFLIERKEDNIYDFFTIQEDSKVVWFTGCFAWGYGACNASVPGISTRQHNLCGCGLCHFEWRIRYLRFFFGRGKEEKHISYLNLFVTAAAILSGILSIVYFRYLISIMPVFSGALLLIESVVYFIAALCAESRLKALLVILSLLVAGGGMALVIFTFGFGGLQPFAKIFSGLLFLSCVIELLLGLIYRNKN